MFDRRALIGEIILGVIIVASPAYTQEKSIVVASRWLRQSLRCPFFGTSSKRLSQMTSKTSNFF